MNSTISILLVVLTALWYGTSIVSTNTSKTLLSIGNDAGLELNPLELTTLQMWVSSLTGLIVVGVVKAFIVRDVGIFTNAKAYGTVATLAVIFGIGFLTLNMAYQGMSASLANTLRATEPLVSLGLSRMIYGKSSGVNGRTVLAVLPIVVGACMASYGNAEFTWFGFGCIMVSNLCFCLRTILYKAIRASNETTDVLLFFAICLLSAMSLTAFLFVSSPERTLQQIGVLLNHTTREQQLWVILNGVAFFSYLQLSFVVLSYVSVLTHAVLNSFRRPAVILASVLQFGTKLSNVNMAGVAIACLGVSFYSYVKSNDAKRGSGKKETKSL